jgi:hypothetical protein
MEGENEEEEVDDEVDDEDEEDEDSEGQASTNIILFEKLLIFIGYIMISQI